MFLTFLDSEMPGLVFENLQREVKVGGENLKYYDLSTVLPKEKYERLPYSIRVLLESAIRNCDNFQVFNTIVYKKGIMIARCLLQKRFFFSLRIFSRYPKPT